MLGPVLEPAPFFALPRRREGLGRFAIEEELRGATKRQSGSCPLSATESTQRGRGARPKKPTAGYGRKKAGARLLLGFGCVGLVLVGDVTFLMGPRERRPRRVRKTIEKCGVCFRCLFWYGSERAGRRGQSGLRLGQALYDGANV